jgi:GxxExxY protein
LVHEIHQRHEKDGKLLLKEESYRIVGACFEVYKEKGCGFHESVYQECLRIEFEIQRIPAIEKPSIQLDYKDRKLNQTYSPDFICFGAVILELKAMTHLAEDHSAQVMNYLKSTGMRLGLLVNFGHYPKLEYVRVAAHDKWCAEPADLKS